MSLFSIKSNGNLTCYGKRDYGKSYAMKKMIRYVSKYIPIFIYDIKHEYYGFPEIKDIRKVNFDVKKGAYRYRSRGTKEDFNLFCQIIYNAVIGNKKRRCIVVVDELQKYVSTNAISKYKYFSDMVFMGRSYGLAVWCITQRPAKIDSSITSQSDVIISFKMDFRLDLDAVENYFDRDSVKNLNKWEFLVYESSKGVSKHGPL